MPDITLNSVLRRLAQVRPGQARPPAPRPALSSYPHLFVGLWGNLLAPHPSSFIPFRLSSCELPYAGFTIHTLRTLHTVLYYTYGTLHATTFCASTVHTLYSEYNSPLITTNPPDKVGRNLSLNNPIARDLGAHAMLSIICPNSQYKHPKVPHNQKLYQNSVVVSVDGWLGSDQTQTPHRPIHGFPPEPRLPLPISHTRCS